MQVEEITQILRESPSVRLIKSSMGHRTKRILRIERKEYQTY